MLAVGAMAVLVGGVFNELAAGIEGHRSGFRTGLMDSVRCRWGDAGSNIALPVLQIDLILR